MGQIKTWKLDITFSTKYKIWYEIWHKFQDKILDQIQSRAANSYPPAYPGCHGFVNRFWAGTFLFQCALDQVTMARCSLITRYVVFYPDLLAVGGGTHDMCACIVERVEIQKFLNLNMYPMDSEGSHKYKTLLLKKKFPTQLTQISICVFLTFSWY